MERPDVSIVLPCRNEEAAVGQCIGEAKAFLERTGLRGEIIVVDNGSTDGSAKAARACGARIIEEARPGYGQALRAGFAAAEGRVILLGDCDTTYDLNNMEALYEPLADGKCDMMIGDRFAGLMEKDAMPLLHRLGVPFLSLCGRLRWGVRVHDFHCGIRGITREAASRCTWTCPGMEFATEMIAEATHKGLRIGQVEVPLRKCVDEKRVPKLRKVRDGWRHLKFIISCLTWRGRG